MYSLVSRLGKGYFPEMRPSCLLEPNGIVCMKTHFYEVREWHPTKMLVSNHDHCVKSMHKLNKLYSLSLKYRYKAQRPTACLLQHAHCKGVGQ